MSFMTLFFQTAGVSDAKAAVLSMALTLASGAGHFGGGLIGDAFARKCRYHGRPLTAQLSVLFSIPVLYFMFSALAPSPGNFCFYLAGVVGFGLTATWCAAGVNWPIFSEIVPADSRSAIIAWDTAIEGASGAIMGNCVVTHLASDIFGYKLEDQNQAATPENARALGNALTWTTTVPFLVCMGFYSFLHWSYPRDLKRMEFLARESEDSADDLDNPGYEMDSE